MQVETMKSVQEAHAVTAPVCLFACSVFRTVLVEQQEATSSCCPPIPVQDNGQGRPL